MKKVFIYLILLFNFIIYIPLYGNNDYLSKANKYYNEGKFSLAQIFYQKALENKPDSFIANYNLGKIYFYDKDYKNALKYFQRASDLKEDKEITFFIANSYAMAGKPEKALSIYSNILKKYPDYADVYLNAGLVSFKKLYNKKLTIYFWENFLKIRPNDTQAENIKKALAYLKDPNFILKPPVTSKSNIVNNYNKNTSSGGISNNGAGSNLNNILPEIKIKGKDIMSTGETRYKIKDKKKITTD